MPPKPFTRHLLNRFCFLVCLLLGADAGAGVGGIKSQSRTPPPAGLMTLRINIDQQRLFDPHTGWFVEGPNVKPNDWKKSGANFWTHASHPARAILITPAGRTVFDNTVDFRLFGGMSRLHPQKSFSLSCREKYGASRIRYPIFGPAAPAEFKYLVVRNAGSDWGRAYLRDALLTGLLRDPSWELDRQAARPAVVYINGVYWGFYHLREKINPHFLAQRYGIDDKDKIDLLEGQGGVKHGGRREYDRLVKFIRRNDLGEPGAYAEVKGRMNVDNFQRLQIAQAYFDNQDAGGNLRYWRDRTDPNSRWRWILYDVDQGFGLHSPTAYERNTVALFTEADGPAWPNPPWSTLIHRSLLRNPDYRRNYVNRSLDYLHTDFRAERVVAAIDERAAAIAPEMARHGKRWNRNEGKWPAEVERLREFARRRPGFLREHLREHFDGGPDRSVEISATEGGFVSLNDNITVEDGLFTGRYFANYPLHLRAVARRGYTFVKWSNGRTGVNRIVNLRKAAPLRLQAIFAPASAPQNTSPPVSAAPAPSAPLPVPKSPAPAPMDTLTLADLAAAATPAPATGADPVEEYTAKKGLSTSEVLSRLGVGLFVFVLVGLYGSLRKKAE